MAASRELSPTSRQCLRGELAPSNLHSRRNTRYREILYATANTLPTNENAVSSTNSFCSAVPSSSLRIKLVKSSATNSYATLSNNLSPIFPPPLLTSRLFLFVYRTSAIPIEETATPTNTTLSLSSLRAHNMHAYADCYTRNKLYAVSYSAAI